MKNVWKVRFEWDVSVTKMEYERKTEKSIFFPRTRWGDVRCSIYSRGTQYCFSMAEAVELAKRKIAEKIECRKLQVTKLQTDLAKIKTEYDAKRGKA